MCEQKNSTEVLIDEIIALTKAGVLDYYIGLDITNILRDKLDKENAGE